MIFLFYLCALPLLLSTLISSYFSLLSILPLPLSLSLAEEPDLCPPYTPDDILPQVFAL